MSVKLSWGSDVVNMRFWVLIRIPRLKISAHITSWYTVSERYLSKSRGAKTVVEGAKTVVEGC